MINPMNLSGKHIIITGASSGIGRETCIMASKLGSKISLIARNHEALKETVANMDGSGHNYYEFDLNNVSGIESMISSIVKQDGTIDGFVHCAGIGSNRPLKVSSPSFVEEMTRIHYFSFIELLRSISAKGRSNNGASYVGISSVAAFKPDRAQGAYGGAKSAMSTAAHAFAKELALRGIRVNTIAFGMVDTRMYKEFKESGGNNEELMRNQTLGVIPVEYAAKAICFQLSDASKYMTGGTMYYDAGMLA